MRTLELGEESPRRRPRARRPSRGRGRMRRMEVLSCVAQASLRRRVARTRAVCAGAVGPTPGARAGRTGTRPAPHARLDAAPLAHPVGWVCGRDRGQGARAGPWAGCARAIEGRARERGRHLGRAVWRRSLVSPMGTSLRPSSLMGVRSHQPRGVQPVCRLARLGLGSLCARALLPSCCLPPARPDATPFARVRGLHGDRRGTCGG